MIRKKRWFGILIMLIFLCTCSIPTMAQEKREDNIPYDFPVKPSSTEWKNFNSKQEMLDVCQIPEEKLKNMTTEALLETVLNYPLVTTYYAFNSVKDAYNRMSNDFNGFRELFSRSDISEVLLKKYSNVNILSEKEIKTVESSISLEPSTVEYLLSCNEIQNGHLSSEDNQIFEKIHEEKSSDREKEGIYSEFSEVYLRYRNETAENRAGENWQSIMGKVNTPNGSNVPDVYKRTPELTAGEKDIINSEVINKFPNAKKLGEHTVRYNCHSYAWYSQSTSNPYWIGKEYPPYIYITDGSYNKWNDAPRAGTRAWYSNGEHSAISTGPKIENGVQIFYVESKWGMAGLYEHIFSYSPYGNNIQWYK